MIDWRPISAPPVMVTRLDEPLRLGGRNVPGCAYSARVLVLFTRPDGSHDWDADQICIMDGYPDAFGAVYGRAVTHWSPVDLPGTRIP